MKRLRYLALLAAMVATFAFATTAGAAPQTANVGTLLSGLVTVNVGDVTIGKVIDVSNVLNNNQIDILRNAVQNNPIASNNSNFLNNALQNASILNSNDIVIGILNGVPVVLRLP